MLTFIWAGAAIAFVPVLLLVLLLIKADVGDIVYAMLSGSIVGLIAGVFALAKGIKTDKAAFLVFAASWAGPQGGCSPGSRCGLLRSTSTALPRSPSISW
jgi:hypothetical protein